MANKTIAAPAPLLFAQHLRFDPQDAAGMEIVLRPGDRIGILGAPGSGKTRLLRTLARLDPVAAGKVAWAGVNVTRKPRWLLGKLRTFVALVLQNPYTFMEPWAAVGKTLNISDTAASLAQTLGLTPLSPRYSVQMLSGVGRTRLALVRALLYQPAVLLVDDVFGSIAPDVWAELLQGLVRALHEKQALLVASQFAAAFNMIETVFVVCTGMVVEWGAREAVFSNPAHPYTRWLLSRTPGTPLPSTYSATVMEKSFTLQSNAPEIVEVASQHWVRYVTRR